MWNFQFMVLVLACSLLSSSLFQVVDSSVLNPFGPRSLASLRYLDARDPPSLPSRYVVFLSNQTRPRLTTIITAKHGRDFHSRLRSIKANRVQDGCDSPLKAKLERTSRIRYCRRSLQSSPRPWQRVLQPSLATSQSSMIRASPYTVE